MGFNKRYINKEGIISNYKMGLERLIEFIQKPDCIIIEDKFSEKIVDIILNDDTYIAREKLEKLIS
jgi:hypothetical protein